MGLNFQNDTVFQICLQKSNVPTPTMTEECLAAVCFDERPSLELVKIQAIQEPMISVRRTPKTIASLRGGPAGSWRAPASSGGSGAKSSRSGCPEGAMNPVSLKLPQ